MKASNLRSVFAILGILLGAVSAEAQHGRDEDVLVPLARGVVGEPAPIDTSAEGAAIEELPAVVAPRWSAEDDARSRKETLSAASWVGLFVVCLGTAGALALRQPVRHTPPRPSLPNEGAGRISLV